MPTRAQGRTAHLVAHVLVALAVAVVASRPTGAVALPRWAPAQTPDGSDPAAGSPDPAATVVTGDGTVNVFVDTAPQTGLPLTGGTAGFDPAPPTETVGGLEYRRSGFDDPISLSDLDPVDRVRLGSRLTGGEPDVTRVDEGLWVVPFEVTEIGKALRLAGEVNETVITVPIPDGFRPVSMRASMTVSPDVDTGYVEYFGRGGTARALQLSGRTERDEAIEVELDISDFEPVNGNLRITFRNRLRSEDPPCTTSLLGAYVDFRQGVFVLAGDPLPPTTVGAFLPRLLETVDIRVPVEPSLAEAAAAADMAVAASRVAIGGAPEISLHPLWHTDSVPSVPDSPTTRTIVISEDLEPGVRIVPTDQGGAVLAIGGTGDELRLVTRALVSDYAALAAGSDVLVERFDPDGVEGQLRPGTAPLVDLDGDGEPEPFLDVAELTPEALAFAAPAAGGQADAGTAPSGTGPGDPADAPAERQKRFTFDELQLGRLRLTGVGRMDLPLSFSQATLGGPVESMKIHLEGAYTPLSRDAEGSMTVNLNSVLVEAVNLEGDGDFSIDIDVPPAEIRRATTVTITVDYSPEGGCNTAGAVPVNVQIDPEKSWVRISPGQSLVASFARYPQVLVDGFVVAVDRYTIDRVELAVRLVAALQRVSTPDLDPRFVPLDEALVADQPAVIVAENDPRIQIDAPLLSLDPISVIDENRTELLRFDVDLAHAVLEAFDVGDHDRLLLTWSGGRRGSTATGLHFADQLLDSFSTRNETWAVLFGDTYLLSQGSPPLSISLRGDSVQPTAGRPAPDYLARAKPLAIAAVFIAAVAWALGRLRRWRIRRLEEEEARRAMRLSMARIADQLGADELADGPADGPGTL
ncbi:MAG: hypothetical protein D6683_16065 [Actinomyces sp.]|nr:MAG: hypothetical protein D6683_16065 [Actinomyces sp.]